MSKPTGKLAFAYQSIANLENRNQQLKDRIAELERERDQRDLEQRIKALEDYAKDVEKAADDTPLGAESRSRGASVYNWLRYFAQSTKGRAEQLRKGAGNN